MVTVNDLQALKDKASLIQNKGKFMLNFILGKYDQMLLDNIAAYNYMVLEIEDRLKK